MKGAPGTFPLEELTEEARVILKLVPNLSYISGVEVGTLRGKTAAILLHRRPGLHLVCVDNWSLQTTVVADSADDIKAAWHLNMAPFRRGSKRSHLIPYDSILAAKTPAGFVADCDFVYLDADHTYEATAADIRAWWPHVRPGGLLMGHDYGRKGPSGEDHGWGVDRAVNEFLAETGLPMHHLEDTTWAILKPV